MKKYLLLVLLLLLCLSLLSCAEEPQEPVSETPAFMPERVAVFATAERFHGACFYKEFWAVSQYGPYLPAFDSLCEDGYLYGVDLPAEMTGKKGNYVIGSSGKGETVVSIDFTVDSKTYTVMLHKLLDVGFAPADFREYMKATERADVLSYVWGEGRGAIYAHKTGGVIVNSCLLNEDFAVSVASADGEGALEILQSLSFTELSFEKPYGVTRRYGEFCLVNLQRPRYNGILVDDNSHLTYVKTERETSPQPCVIEGAEYVGTHYHAIGDLSVREYKLGARRFEFTLDGKLRAIGGVALTKNYQVTGRTAEEARVFLESHYSAYVDFSGDYVFSVTEWEYSGYDQYCCKWDGEEQDIYFVNSLNRLLVIPAPDAPIPSVEDAAVRAVIDAYIGEVFLKGKAVQEDSYRILVTANVRYRDTDCLFVKLLVRRSESYTTTTEFLIFPERE